MSSNEHTSEVRSAQMRRMTEAEAIAAGLYTVIDASGVPAYEAPTTAVERARRLVSNELVRMVRGVLRDGFHRRRLIDVREMLGELHVDFDMLAEELRTNGPVVESGGDPAVAGPAEVADDVAALADELAANVEEVLRDGFNRYLLVEVLENFDVLLHDFAAIRAQISSGRGAA